MTASVDPREAARTWRSLLFVPTHLPRFVSRAHERGADSIVLDLEDAVPVAEKAAARQALAGCVQGAGRNGAAVLVRVNHGLRALAADLDAAVVAGVAALMLPKVESAGWVAEVADAVAEVEAERGLPHGGIGLVLQIKTPAALPRLAALAEAHTRVLAMALGPEDFCAAIGAAPGQDSLLSPNLAVLCAAWAAGIVPLGFVGSIGAYDDTDAFRATIAQARQLGFRGALAVHPKQVEIMKELFAPMQAECDWARRVLDGDLAARAAGQGAFSVDGRMVDAPVVRRAREIAARSRPAPAGVEAV